MGRTALSRWLWLVVAIAAMYPAWVWFQRRQGDVRMERAIEAKRSAANRTAVDNAGTAVRIVQFYARSGVVVEGEQNLICYGVENAKEVWMEPTVETLYPTRNRCFFHEPRQDTTYTLTAVGYDGARTSATFQVRVEPAPPAILFLAQSHKEIHGGDAVTVCYGVAHATSVRLEPIGWTLAPSSRNCTRLYPHATTAFTLVAAGEGGRTDRQKFTVTVK